MSPVFSYRNYYENLPTGWSLIKLSKISKSITKGTTPRGGNIAYLNSGVGFLRAENISGYTKINLSTLKFISPKIHLESLKRSILEENDILITIAGTLGRTGLVKKEYLPLNTNQAVSIVRLINTTTINLKYIIYCLNSPLIQKKLTTQKKITAIPNLTLEIICNLLIPICPLNEQINIVRKINHLLNVIND